MKYSVYKEEEESKPTVRLKLGPDAGGESMYVAAVDKNGLILPGGYLLRLTPNGGLIRTQNVNRGLGLRLTGRGQIQLDE